MNQKMLGVAVLIATLVLAPLSLGAAEGGPAKVKGGSLGKNGAGMMRAAKKGRGRGGVAGANGKGQMPPTMGRRGRRGPGGENGAGGPGGANGRGRGGTKIGRRGDRKSVV